MLLQGCATLGNEQLYISKNIRLSIVSDGDGCCRGRNEYEQATSNYLLNSLIG